MRSAVFLLSLLAAGAGAPALAEGDYWPTCADPQPLAPLAVIGGGEDLAWNGHEYAAVWAGPSGFSFQRLFADGSAAARPVRFATDGPVVRAAITWASGRYGIAWSERRPGGNYTAMFVLVDPWGAPASAPIDLSGGFANAALVIDLAWSGNVFGVVWEDDLPYSVWAALVDADGRQTFARFRPCLCEPFDPQFAPTLTWSRAARHFLVAWTEEAAADAIVTTWFDETGSLGPTTTLVTGSAVGDPVLAAPGGFVGMLYRDDGSLYFANVVADGTALGSAPVFIAVPEGTRTPLAWTGAEYGAFWNEASGAMFQRIAGAGTLVDGAFPVGFGTGVVAAGFGRHGYLLTMTGPQALAWGCRTPATPLCPESVGSYSVTGRSATVSWLPVPDDATDIAYYEIYRDNALAGRSAFPSLNDIGLTPGVPYDYDVRTVNAAQMVSAPCPDSSATVITSDALQLQVAKAGTDLNLTWAGGTDASYRVMRGTSPRFMTEIQRTPAAEATDSGAAVGPVCYFYSIDPPE